MAALLPPPPRKNGYGTLPAPLPAREPRPPSLSAASLYSRIMFAYANPVMDTSNRRQLHSDDLWALEGDNLTAVTYASFRRHFSESGASHSLVSASVRTYGWTFAWCGLAMLFSVACGIFAPAVLHHVIDAVSAPQLDTQNLLVWLAAFFASKILAAFVVAHSNFHSELAAQRLSASLKALLFEKAMRRSSLTTATTTTSSSGSTDEQDDDNDDDDDDDDDDEEEESVDMANLYSSDVDDVLSAAFEVNKAWVLPIQIAGIVAMLFAILGLAALAGLAVIAISFGTSFTIASFSSKVFGRIMEFKDARMKLVKEVFGAIQVIKLSAWESRFGDKIRSVRASELTGITRYMYLEALSIFVLWATPLLVSIASFAVYTVVLGETLTAATVFSSMALFNSLRAPLRDLPDVISECIQAQVSLKRMEAFLSLPEFDSSNVVREDDPRVASNVAIQIQDGSFGWNASQALLANVELTIHKGDFVVIHGAIGAGKSALCLALLGEMHKPRGSVFVRGRVAYYSQQPWIQNQSIRENILFGATFEEVKYRSVLDACGLVSDIAGFPAGDATEIGQKGINLSGGQKARLCLARACYADADVLILDSPLAAVDAVVQREIFSKCLCGLLSDKTVVLVTHAPEIISSNAVNFKLEIKDGQLFEQRTERDPAKPRRAYATHQVSQSDSHSSTTLELSPRLHDDQCNNTSARLVQAEVREEGRVSKAVFAKYFDALGGWRMCVFLFVVQILWQGFQIRSDLWLSHWTGQRTSDTAATSDDNAETLYNLKVYVLLGLGSASMVLVRTLAVSFLGLRASQHLFEWMTQSLLRAPLRFFDATPIGRILARYGADMAQVDFRVPIGFGGFISTGFFTVCQLATAVYTVHFLGVLVVPLVYIYVSMASFYLAPSREVSRLEKVAASPVLSHVTSSEDGVAVLRAFGASYVERAVAENLKRIDVGNQVFFAEAVIGQWFQVRMQLIGAGVVIAIVSSLMYLHASLTPGVIGLAFAYALNVDGGLIGLVRVWSYVEVCMVSPERILEYASIPAEGDSSGQLLQIEPPREWPTAGAVVFENVVFSYKPGAPAVLKGVSFAIQSKQKIGIVGRTGAGKSSLTMALFRIAELDSGRVLIDGRDIASVPLQSLRARLSIIPQSPVLFKGPLRGYMDPFDEFTDTQIWSALQKVDMHDTIASLDGQLTMELHENGANFSVGERQMLCLARATLTQAAIVVLDEATASIDHATERKLQRAIHCAFKDATVLTIAHRLATVLESDRILVLSDGAVVEFDTPSNLIQNESGMFYALAKEGGVLDKIE